MLRLVGFTVPVLFTPSNNVFDTHEAGSDQEFMWCCSLSKLCCALNMPVIHSAATGSVNIALPHTIELGCCSADYQEKHCELASFGFGDSHRFELHGHQESDEFATSVAKDVESVHSHHETRQRNRRRKQELFDLEAEQRPA